MRLCVDCEPEVGSGYAALLGFASVAEECGFDGFFLADHYQFRGPARLPGPVDAWTTLAGLARDTQRLRLGTLVSPVTFRLPGPLAVAVAQVDVMSGGRVELGMGTGHFEREHRSYGIPFPSLSERFDRLEEQLSIVKGVWSTPIDGAFSFSGKHYSLEDCPGLPKPTQQPHPPIIVGGRGANRTPALAARFADELNVSYVGPAETALAYERARRACEAIGRDPATLRLSTTQLLCCGADDAEVARRAEVLAGFDDPAAAHRGISTVSDYAAVGTPDRVVANLQALAAVGAERAYLHGYDFADHDHLRLVAETVLPHLTT